MYSNEYKYKLKTTKISRPFTYRYECCSFMKKSGIKRLNIHIFAINLNTDKIKYLERAK